MEIHNHTIKTLTIIFFCIATFSSCTNPLEKEFNKYQHDKDTNENNNGNGDSDKHDNPDGRYGLKSFSIKKSDNGDIPCDIEFTILGNNLVYGICPSDFDITHLKPSFDTGDGQVKINGVNCESGQYPFDFSQKMSVSVETKTGIMHYTVSLIPFTGLPVIEILTDNYSKITSKETWLSGYMNTYGFGLVEDSQDTIFVKKRGNGTAYFPKISFNVKLTSRKHVLDMKKQKRWCFLANYRDRTLLRNDVAFYLGKLADSLEWTPDSRFAEIILNGKHEGIYQVTEQIRVDKHRVDIDELTAADINGEAVTGGYLLEIDQYNDDNVYKFTTPILSLPVNIKNPNKESCQPEQLEYITEFFGTVETMLYEGKYEEVYEKYLDIHSFIDYYLVQTLTNNTEFADKYSVYCYKKRNGKLYAGPLWDFEYTTFTKESSVSNIGALWYQYLFKDEAFKKALKQRWNVLKPIFEQNIYSYIEQQQSILTKSAHIDETIYPKGDTMMKNGDEELTFEEAIARMTKVIKERIDYMDNLYMKY